MSTFSGREPRGQFNSSNVSAVCTMLGVVLVAAAICLSAVFITNAHKLSPQERRIKYSYDLKSEAMEHKLDLAEEKAKPAQLKRCSTLKGDDVGGDDGDGRSLRYKCMKMIIREERES